MELCKIQVISERQCLETAMPNKFYKLYSQLIQAGTNRMKMSFGSVPFDRKKERDREREGGMEEERDTHTHKTPANNTNYHYHARYHYYNYYTLFHKNISTVFLKIKSVCRNVETKGKVFWK